MKNKGRYLIAIGLLAGLFLLIVGCSNDMLIQPRSESNNVTINILEKPPGTKEPITYPQSGTYVYTYWNARDAYRGGTLMCSDGSVFTVNATSLIPPPGHTWGEDVTVTMTIDKDEVDQKLIFTFGPSGTSFNPAAKVFMNYKNLNIENPKLYYINEEGNYIPQLPDDVDVTNRSLIVYVSHFSRYAIASE